MPRQPIFNVPPITLWLSVVMVAVFAVINLLPETLWGPIINRMVVVPQYFALIGQWTIFDALTVVSSLVFYAFVHVAPIHLVGNLGFFAAFGSVCERQFGKSSASISAPPIRASPSWMARRPRSSRTPKGARTTPSIVAFTMMASAWSASRPSARR
jgi:hypothetical protein